jgi:hypothetical protein
MHVVLAVVAFVGYEDEAAFGVSAFSTEIIGTLFSPLGLRS